MTGDDDDRPRVPVPPGGHIARCSLRSPATILAESSGEVVAPATYHARTDEPIAGGLFDPAIFGAVAPTADRAGEARRDRWGHIQLPFPVPHPLGGGLLEVIPVAPPWYRPVVRTSIGWMISDLNVLYRKVVELVGWFRKMEGLDLPAPALRARQQQMRELVAHLFDNEARPDPQRVGGRPLVSLAGMMRGVRATGGIGAGEQLRTWYRAAALDVRFELRPLPRFGARMAFLSVRDT